MALTLPTGVLVRRGDGAPRGTPGGVGAEGGPRADTARRRPRRAAAEGTAPGGTVVWIPHSCWLSPVFGEEPRPFPTAPTAQSPQAPRPCPWSATGKSCLCPAGLLGGSDHRRPDRAGRLSHPAVHPSCHSDSDQRSSVLMDPHPTSPPGPLSADLLILDQRIRRF